MAVFEGDRDIAKPVAMTHDMHVRVNPDTGELEGLPPEWDTLIQEVYSSRYL